MQFMWDKRWGEGIYSSSGCVYAFYNPVLWVAWTAADFRLAKGEIGRPV